MANFFRKHKNQFTFGLLGGKAIDNAGDAPDTQTTTTINEPWSGLKQPLLDYYGSAGDWYRSGSPLVAGVPSTTQAAWDLTTQRALQGSPMNWAAQQNAYDTLSGNMFDQGFNNQWDYAAGKLGKTFQDITMPSIASRFSMAGRSGSGAEQDMYGRAMGELGTSLKGLAADIYGQERGRQMQAMTQVPYLSALDYEDFAKLGAVGEGQRAYQQQLLNEPYQRVAQYGSLLSPGMNFGTQTTTQPLYQNYSGLGSLVGMGAGYYFGGPPGAMLGAQAGGTLGGMYGG